MTLSNFSSITMGIPGGTWELPIKLVGVRLLPLKEPPNARDGDGSSVETVADAIIPTCCPIDRKARIRRARCYFFKNQKIRLMITVKMTLTMMEVTIGK